MYLKSIEMQGFKSFANKIVLTFEGGITGIVGPNGSGKSNIADAVRWVLGEQSAKELRGASMTDVIFEGTENRRALSFAYVALTIDNSDHTLPVDYEEVTVARRVYRSGESEYLINGTSVRLKDVNELFYDTGIGKEGYSIIGQGQIEKILSGKPEERRELFDEAVGIVKYKRRKAEAQKKLQAEHDDLTRVNDILSELEKQVGPLEEQAETAKRYLAKKEELKKLDANYFLAQAAAKKKENESLFESRENAEKDLSDLHAEDEEIKREYDSLSGRLSALDEEIEDLRQKKDENIANRGRLNQQITVLTERISAGEKNQASFGDRIAELERDKEEKQKELARLTGEKDSLDSSLSEVEERLKQVEDEYYCLEAGIKEKNEKIENNKAALLSLITERSEIKAKKERNQTLLEQIRIRKASLNKQLVEQKTHEEEQQKDLSDRKEAYEAAGKKREDLKQKADEAAAKVREWEGKLADAREKLTETERQQSVLTSNLELLENMAERYEGFGNSVKRVMENKDNDSGIIGTVSDLLSTEKKYETAIETALAANIRNIVTEDEDCAKRQIEFLKREHLGRATFLPLSSVQPHELSDERVLSEKGVLGRASDLVRTDSKYRVVAENLLGGFLVADTMENAIALQRKNRFRLRIVTLEGELFAPGGSMTGGSFKNKSNVLGRNRELEAIREKLSDAEKAVKDLNSRIGDLTTAKDLAADDSRAAAEALSEAALAENTAKVSYDTALSRRQEEEKLLSGVEGESSDADKKIAEIAEEQKAIEESLSASVAREKELNDETEALKNALDEQTYMETASTRALSEAQVEAASAKEKQSFAAENLARIQEELKKAEKSESDIRSQEAAGKAEIERMKADIASIKETLGQADGSDADLEAARQEKQKEKEEVSASFKKFFDQKEEVQKKISSLEREVDRLSDRIEKNDEAVSYQTNYLWNEYELTPHQAEEFADPEMTDPAAMNKQISSVRNEIRGMGNVNVNAIEDYKEVSERYNFLKGQHDDLIEAEESLKTIIDELTEGMKTRFNEGFADINREFKEVFRTLFGGGSAELSLTDEEDVLESGIRITCSPPGKKLQNMMQLSGGEKSLTAIALLFAIQNLKPSPFCLLDEIEAALDDANVDRFAKYLHKLTKNTQFIIITHRRGTMKAADQLYGITMQEKGVSTQVSVNLVENDLTD